MKNENLIKEMFEKKETKENLNEQNINNSHIEEKLEEIIEEKEENKNIDTKKRKILIISIIISIILLLIVFSTIFSLININNENIMSGVKIEGIQFSGLTKEEAKQKLDVIYNEKLQKDITLEYEDYQTTINPSSIQAKYNIDEAVNQAYDIGRSSNIFINNYNILFALLGIKDINIEISINEEDINNTIDGINSELPNALEEVNYYIEDDNLVITRGKEGIVIKSEVLKKEIKKQLEDITTTEYYIIIPVETKNPEEIDIEKIYDEVYKEVQDAYYTTDPFKIYPEVEGIDFDIEEANKIIAAEYKEEYTIPLTITEPKVTTSQIGTEAFPDLIATYTTKYDASDVDRSTNLQIACEKINDKVVLPGEIFSYNKTLGERTIAAGYKNAKVYENGKVVDGIGGGICQISSTLYNAILLANMEATERRNHQFVTSYVPAGRDATVVYGLIDFKFKNTRTYAIKIKASASNGIAKVSIYGIKEEKEYNISIEPKVISSIPYTVKYVEDSTLSVGTEKVQQKGANGYVTETYLVKSLNGVVVSKELLSKDTYNAMQRIILKGTKGSTQIDTTVPKEEKPEKEENVTNNTIENNAVQNNVTNNTIENNTVQNNVTNNTTQNNTVQNNVTNNTIENNTVQNNITNNTIADNITENNTFNNLIEN